MRFLLCCICAGLALPVYSQSKKELQAEVTRLQSQVSQLNAQIAELKKPVEVNLSDSTDQVSYCFGVVIGSNMQNTGLDSLNMESFLVAMKDVFSNKPLKVERTEAQATMQRYMQQVMMKKSAEAKAQSEKFLEGNKATAGVKTTASGLQYKVLSQGTGKMPTTTDRVTVHYTGKLTDGTVFDSSVQRGQPATFRVNQVIPGWTEALQMMKEGDKWTLYIPYSLGYGERGSPPQIPPFSTLIFDVELMKVN
ncbi:MAG: FKBP-type peptidyl-prolyl cis-trans isomerase [Chryseosolibacter sp.]